MDNWRFLFEKKLEGHTTSAPLRKIMTRFTSSGMSPHVVKGIIDGSTEQETLKSQFNISCVVVGMYVRRRIMGTLTSTEHALVWHPLFVVILGPQNSFYLA